jgi:hypothetical protein
MTLTRVLHTLVNEESALEALVARIGGGYSVVLRDLDSGEYLPEARIYRTEAAALAHAERILGGTDGAEFGWSVPLN